MAMTQRSVELSKFTEAPKPELMKVSNCLFFAQPARFSGCPCHDRFNLGFYLSDSVCAYEGSASATKNNKSGLQRCRFRSVRSAHRQVS